ncbi:formylmethanofuran dehydrogenase subunit E family protein [Patescibacteria group bacterium]
MIKKYSIIFILVVILFSAGVVYLQFHDRDVSTERVQTVFGSGFELTSCEQIVEQDVYELCLRVRDKDAEEFESIVLTNKFHQHIGPNNIYGAKMALYAKKLLEGENHNIRVLSEAGTAPPMSCLNDGIMVAIGATFGRDLIQIMPGSSTLAATFYYNDKSVRLEVKPEKLKVSQEKIADSLKEYGGLTEDYFKDVREMGLYVWEHYSQDDLFIVSTQGEGENHCNYTEQNVNYYFAQMHNYLHTSPTNDEIIDFIDQDSCVTDGSVAITEYGLEISAIWKSSGETVIYYH